MENDDQQSRGLHILVVDDNVDLAATTSLLLELEGHRTDIAHNGLDAVGAATSEHYDAVLLDLNMPIMDGFQAAAALGQLRPAPALIAHSACDDVLTRKRTAELGFSAHLTKPVPLGILRAVLRQVCRSDHAGEPRLNWVAGARAQETSNAHEREHDVRRDLRVS